MAALLLLSGEVWGQGQRCETKADCTDEYNPNCSKWGYCVNLPVFGSDGPGTSKVSSQVLLMDLIQGLLVMVLNSVQHSK